MNDEERRLKFLRKLKPISKPDESIEVIVCMRAADAEKVAPRCSIAACSECNAPVWVQSDSRRVAPKARLQCLQCLTAKYVS